ncbi:MAG: type II toxin-antitoxin system VapB family antitoxin [Trueperaceae bacterium]|nr:type II toxin-antitoxin system VapB family antitoxin [Trueperaceae bacterium]
MKQINVKNDEVVELLEAITERTGETTTDAMAHALQLYWHALEANERADAAIAFVRDHVHPLLEDRYRANPPSKAQQEDMLGNG